MKFVSIAEMFRGTLILLSAFAFAGLLISQESIDSNQVIYGWNLDKNYILPKKAVIDTNLVNFQLHNVVSRKHTWLTNTGSYGSPYLANSFFSRQHTDDLLFLNSYKDYFNTYSNTIYINTQKPFTHLQYIQSYPKSDREEFLNVFHSQNVTEKLNIGFDITVITDKAQYKYINTSSKSFKLFSSYSGENYTMHSSIDLNRYYSGENGGVIDSSYSDDWKFTKEIATHFTGSGSSKYTPNVTNKIRYLDGMISQNIKLFTFGNNSDSLNLSSSIAQPILSHVLKIRRASKIYENTDIINNQFYNNIYSNLNETYDSTAEYRVSNTIQLDFKTRIKKKVLAGIYANINHDYIKYSYYSLLDTSLVDTATADLNIRPYNDSVIDINSTTRLNSIYISGGIYGKFWTHFESRFSASLYISGYKAGQTKLEGLINTNVKILKKPYELGVKGALENIVPSYQLNTYYSNHYIWNEDFKSINRILLSSKLAAPSNRFELEGHYALLSNYIYFTDSMPVAYNKALSVSALTLEKGFDLWKFHSNNKLTYQLTSNSSIIELPSVLFFNSTYIDHTWKFKMTGGKLRTMLGVDIYYNSGFNGYEYIPALSMFYQQGATYTVGNTPYIDIWLNFKLKRTRFFFKYENITNPKNNRSMSHYYAVNYPAKKTALKFGLSWTFYD